MYNNIYRSMEKRTCCACGQNMPAHSLYNGVCSRCYWAARSKPYDNTMIVDGDGRRF